MNVYGQEKEIVLPIKGMMCTMYVGSDRYAAVCINVISNKKVRILVLYDITEDNLKDYIYKDEDGLEYLKQEFYEKYYYEKYFIDDNTRLYSLRKNGVWYPVGQEMRPGCSGINFGYADPYLDPSF